MFDNEVWVKAKSVPVRFTVRSALWRGAKRVGVKNLPNPTPHEKLSLRSQNIAAVTARLVAANIVKQHFM